MGRGHGVQWVRFACEALNARNGCCTAARGDGFVRCKPWTRANVELVMDVDLSVVLWLVVCALFVLAVYEMTRP